jgi:hypothetical protein
MALLSRLALAALAGLAAAGCYRPEARDCTVSCSQPGDCLADQVCGDDGWCAAPEVAGRCLASDGPRPDGARPDAPPVDAPPADAPPIDAAGADLHVVVSGRGKIVVSPLDVECVGTQNMPGDCHFGVAPGSQVTLLPVTTHQNYPFAGWTTPNCEGSGACELTLEAPVTLVGASFGASLTR